MRKLAGKVIERTRSLVPRYRAGDFIPIAPNGFWRKRSPPTRSLRSAAALFDRMGGETIVEIGTGIHGRMSGNSMLVWPRRTAAKRIIAVDLEPERLDEVRRRTRRHAQVALVLADGIEYLRGFDSRIDLLYLDFWTPDPEHAIPGTGRADAYRDAYEAAKDKLSARSMILIDDTDHVHPWKHTYIVPLARADGYEVRYTGRQTLLVR